MRVYNSLSRTKEEFVPREEGRVAMYVCGPTVYNHIHIGNARTFLSFDVIRRYLEHKGYDVRFIQNITDVDDKIINRANEEGRSSAEVAEEYAEAFISAMRSLGVEEPTARPLATAMIPDMVDLIERLIDGGNAYAVDGDVYFAVRSFPAYGKLSGRGIDDLHTQARINTDDRKRDPLDFALWKAAKPGEPHWPSPWGEGRPGWHIECSAMSEVELGLPFDIHGGGSDLIFPHHENEIAQSEAATGVPFARYWLHGGMLQINSEKMSKSLGNFTLLKDVLLSYDSAIIRLLMLQTHYRSSLDFSDTRLEETTHAYERLANLVRNLRWARDAAACGLGAPAAVCSSLATHIESARRKFDAEMDDDFNTAGALAAVFELAKAANTFIADYQTDVCEADRLLLCDAEDVVLSRLRVLGIEIAEDRADGYPAAVVDLAARVAGFVGADTEDAVQALLATRASARASKQWETADAVRDGLAGLGFQIEDTPQGARVIYRSEGHQS